MEFDVTLTEQDMVRFNLYHTFSRFASWFAMALGVVSLIFAWYFYGRVSGTLTVVYVLLGLFLLIYLPGNTVLSAKHRIRLMPEVLEALHYRVDETGITVSRASESAELPWEKVYRVVSAKTAFYLYSSRVYAYVVPRTALSSEEQEKLIALAKEHLEARRVKGL